MRVRLRSLLWGLRRKAVAAFCGIAIAFPGSAVAATGHENVIPPNLDLAVSGGLAFLARQQSPEGWLDGGGPKVAMTSLSLLAFLASGATPDLGKYGLAVRGAEDWLLSQQASDGYFGTGERGMYTHAIATLTLAQAYGVESGAERRLHIHAALVKAVGVILAAQNAGKSSPIFVGGWRYERTSPDSDLSLSGWNILALRAARDVGIRVPQEALQRAVEFVSRCFDEKAKGFAYQPGADARAGDTAIGMLCLYLLGAADTNAARLDEAAKYLQTHGIDENSPFAYYATYYVTQAAFQRGGDAWDQLGHASLDRLIKAQEKDGGWPQSKASQEPGRVYSTAMALQALAVPYRLLPVYQR